MKEHERKSRFMLFRAACVFIFILILSTIALHHSSAQKSSDDTQPARPNNLHQWGAVTLFHGLPSDRVRAIAQTPDGAMWFGTDGGLARYDGRRTQAITSEGLKGTRVLSLRVDQGGALWAGTEEGASVLRAGAQFQFIKETEGKTVTAIIAPERGRVVMATNDGLLVDIRTQGDGSLTVKTMPDDPLLMADENRRSPLPLTSLARVNEEILVGTQTRGLLSIKGDGVRTIESRPRAFFIQALEQDAQGNLWMGTRARAEESGLYQAGEQLRPVRVGEALGTVSALAADGAGGVWVGTDGRGVYHYQPNDATESERFTFESTSGGLRSDSIYAVFVDRERVVWFGTDKGVCRYDARALRVELISDAERESNFIRTLVRLADGRVVAGTNRGLFIADASMRSWQAVERLSRNTVYAVAEDQEGRLLAGTASGLYASDVKASDVQSTTTFTFVEGSAIEGSSSDSVRSVTTFRGATYSASFGRGVERIEGSRRFLIWPVPSSTQTSREVVSLYAEGDERLWIGTARGEVLTFDGKTIISMTGPELLKGSAVWDIQSGGEGLYWIASAKGLYSFKNGELTNLVSGLDVRRVVAARDETGARAVWCVTAGGGLMKVLITENFGALVSRFDVEQGLPSQNAFALLLSREEKGREGLLVGTSRGLAHYEPGQVAPVLLATRIISRRVHQPEELREGLRLEYPQNSLVLDVQAASSRTFPEQFQYGFLLFDEAGRLVKQKLSRDAQFTMEGLKPGRYRVEARAFNADLISSEPLRFEFAVAAAPFPWTTAALAVLLALALVALSWGYFQNRRMARTSSELLEANRNLADARLQVANQAERERRRIARDLHDQTLADLRNLILLTDELPAKEEGNGHGRLDPAAFRSEIEAISTEIRRICEDLSPSVLENVGLAAALEWALSNGVAHAPAECRFEYEFKCPEDLEERVALASGERMQIYRIAQEAINNICRHSGARHVRLEVKATEDQSFLLELEDDGRDFDPKENKRKRSGRGLSNILARASLIEAEVKWARRSKGGTVFTLHKPAHVAKPESQI